MYKSKFYTILGIFIVLFITYRTLILERVPYKINGTIGFYLRLVIVCVVVSQIIILFNTVKQIINREFKKIKLFQKIVEYIYEKPLLNIGEKLLKFKSFQTYIENCAGTLWYTLKKPYQVYLIVIIFIILPRIIISTALVLDVILINKIQVFFEIIWMYVMSYVFQGTVGCINMFFTHKRDIIPLKVIAQTSNSRTLAPTISTMSQIEYDKQTRIWLYYFVILNCIDAINEVKKTKIILFFSLISTSLFILGWSSYLYIVSKNPSFLIITDPFILSFLQWLLKTIRIL